MLKLPKIFSLLGLLLILIGSTACQAPSKNTIVDQTIPVDGETISATSAIGVAFKVPMGTDSVEDTFAISPEVDGTFAWEENTLWFEPKQAFTSGETYQVKINGELKDREGETIPVNLHWDFTIREPELVYYQLTGEWGEIWRATADGQNQRPLTETSGKVIDFAVDLTGSTIIFSVKNEVGGSDLWVMDRAGNDQRLLVKCDQDHCREPSWSRDQVQVAYTREIFNSESGNLFPPKIWLLDVNSGETSQLPSEDAALGHSPSFSPNGMKLAYYDIIDVGIRVIDLDTSQEFFYPTTISGSGDWSPDSTKIIFNDIVPAEHEPFVEVFIADLNTQEITPAFGTTILDTEFSQPRWSPDDFWVAVALRPVNSGISKSLWALGLGSERQQLIADEPSATFSAYQWNPSGQQLAYQRLELGFSPSKISIWIWDWESGGSRQIIDNGGRPLWLP